MVFRRDINMSFDYKVTHHSFDKELNVWDHLTISKEYTSPGVYVLFDIRGECLYVGKSGKVGGRVYKHIHGTKESKRGFQKRICEIKIFIFGMDEKVKMDVCEHWAKETYPPLFSKDGHFYDGNDTKEYLTDELMLWKNWHKFFSEKVDGDQYQKNVINAKLPL
jgi:hypothetical protein